MDLGGVVLPSGANRGTFRLRDPLALGLVIFIACLFGIYTRPIGFFATLWPANAIMLGLLLRLPNAARASGWAAAGIAYLAADLLTGASLTRAVLVNLANIVSVATAYLICVRLPMDTIRLRQPSSMLYIVLASAAGACTAGLVGGIGYPILVAGGPINGSLLWFATEFINYIAILPVILSWPGSDKLLWPPDKAIAERTGLDTSPAARYGLPVIALVVSCLVAAIIGGPGTVAFPVPALLWCGLVYPVFPTAVLALLFGIWSLIAISAGIFSNSVGAPDEITLVVIRLGASLITLAPVTLATAMHSRNELIDLLKRSRRRLDLALDAGGILGTWSLDIPGSLMRVDSKLSDLIGIEGEPAHHGRDAILSSTIHPADREHMIATLKDAIISRSDYQSRFRIVTPQGGIHSLIASGKPVADSQGSPKRITGIVIDVTDYAETEAALHQSNLRFHIITESIPQIVWSTDANGRHDYYNHRWMEFTGIPVEVMGPGTWKTLIHPEDSPTVMADWRECLSNGETYDSEYRLRYHDGTYRWVRVLAQPLRDTDGNISRWYGTATDVDEAKHLELERELVAHELDHRIKNLFALVNGLVSLSVREQPALRPLTEALSARLSALHQAHSLISGKTGANTNTLHALLRQLLKPYEMSGAGNITIAGQDKTIAPGAFKSMALVMHELITNSAKYGALSQKLGRLEASSHIEGDRLKIIWNEQFPTKGEVEEKGGFGSMLIRTIVEKQLHGSLALTFRQDGLTIIIELPLSEVIHSELLTPKHA